MEFLEPVQNHQTELISVVVGYLIAVIRQIISNRKKKKQNG